MRLAMALCLSLVINQSDPTDALPTIKGHRIGETFAEFAAKVPGGSRQVENCRLIAVDPGKAKKLKLDRKQCAMLLAGADQGARFKTTAPAADRTDVPLEATFEGGKLVKIELGIGEQNYFLPRDEWRLTTYDEVVADLTAKFGPPVARDDLATQNSFGTVLHHRYTTWKRGSLCAEAHEVKPDVSNPITRVVVETEDERRADEKRLADKKISLD